MIVPLWPMLTPTAPTFSANSITSGSCGLKSTAWLALDEATEANGCMQYVPGSHQLGVFPVDHDPQCPVHHVPQTGDLWLPPAVTCPVPAGSVIFHHGCTLHTSADNNTDIWRKALIFHFATADAVSDNERLNREVSIGEID